MSEQSSVPPIPPAPGALPAASPYGPAAAQSPAAAEPAAPAEPPAPPQPWAPVAPAPAAAPAPIAPPAAHPAPPAPAVPTAPAAPYAAPAAPSPATPSPATSSPAAYAAPGAPARRPVRVWDLVLTIVLLGLGALGLLFALLTAAVLPQSVADSGGFADPALIAGDQAVIAVSHLVLFLAAAGISIPLLVARRIAFWVPLAAGVVAAVVYWATMMGAVLASGAGAY